MTNAERVHPEPVSPPASLTARLAEAVRSRPFEIAPPDVVTIAKQCVLDWFGVSLAGIAETAASIVRAEVLEQGGYGQATLVGGGELVALPQAALVNGTASHALDYDDVNLQMSGHPTVPVVPAVLAIAEHGHRSGRDLLAAFVAGYEAECLAGSLVLPGHYAVGWHATATLGTLGAAAGCGVLLDLDGERFRHALGIAATQAAGFKSMFGTMCKPFHAGKAASNGLLAARLAARGFVGNPEAIETPQGFAATQTTTFHPERADLWSRDAYAVRDTLFKYHAACYGTHSAIEGLLRLRDQGVRAGEVESIELHVPPAALSMCNIQEPVTALEGKFSLRFTAALALATGNATEDAFTDSRVSEPELIALRDRVRVFGEHEMPGGTEVVVTTSTGKRLVAQVDVDTPDREIGRQQAKLEAKFLSLASPALGRRRAGELLAAVNSLEDCGDIAELLPLAVAGVDA